MAPTLTVPPESTPPDRRGREDRGRSRDPALPSENSGRRNVGAKMTTTTNVTSITRADSDRGTMTDNTIATIHRGGTDPPIMTMTEMMATAVVSDIPMITTGVVTSALRPVAVPLAVI